ncbi:hypothetical protein [Geodermatophilus sp. CPCC 205761]|uniref:hypothetical protein n=1 Tax=Geodermatophilus sp. CPCC 205761 TaxID=2936597 RepID=UPI003EE82489
MTRRGYQRGVATPAPAEGAVLEAPGPDALVLANRPLRDRQCAMSRYGDDHWYLTPGLFEAHAKPVRLNWTKAAPVFRDALKTYAWMLINYEPTDEALATGYRRLSLMTVQTTLVPLRDFAEFLAARGRSHFSEVTEDDLDQYVSAVDAADISRPRKEDYALEVRRLWGHRHLLPPAMRLPEAPPWDGQEIEDLFGERNRTDENRTPRIDERTMNALLTWAMRFVDDFSGDIIAAAHEYNRLAPRGKRRKARGLDSVPRRDLVKEAHVLVREYRRTGRPLPGRMTDTGIELDYYHLARLLDATAWGIRDLATGDVFRHSGLPLVACAAVTSHPTGLIDNEPWLQQPIGYHDVPGFVKMLVAACLIVTAYLSGMRPGELLNLRRGCLHHDERTGMWSVVGRAFKGARTDTGDKAVRGVEREVPWVVVEPVANAIRVMERLHDREVLFPRTVLGEQQREGGALSTDRAPRFIADFIAWVDAYCLERGRRDSIPADRSLERISLSRFRRTLAWYICRRPRGLVAASIQYGHLFTTVTLGYAGNAASGFPDDYAFERFLARLEALGDAQRRLDDGEHVSGPSADVYRQRLGDASLRFPGITLTSGHQARGLLRSPTLQVYEGRGMTCVFDPARARCRLRQGQVDEQITPDLDDCHPNCLNIAETDSDVDVLRERVPPLREIVGDPLVPPLRVERERAELDRVTKIIDEHERTRVPRPSQAKT